MLGWKDLPRTNIHSCLLDPFVSYGEMDVFLIETLSWHTQIGGKSWGIIVGQFHGAESLGRITGHNFWVELWGRITERN